MRPGEARSSPNKGGAFKSQGNQVMQDQHIMPKGTPLRTRQGGGYEYHVALRMKSCTIIRNPLQNVLNLYQNQIKSLQNDIKSY